jgi:hypothetical protein
VKTINIPLDETEVNDLVGLFDLAVRNGGLQAARPALRILDKIQAAAQAANAPETPAADGSAQSSDPKPPVSPKTSPRKDSRPLGIGAHENGETHAS